MTSPDRNSERLDDLLEGAAPTTDQERADAALINELRALDDAPSATLRRRVESIAERPAPEGRSLWARLSGSLLPRSGAPRMAVSGALAALVIAALVAVPALDGERSGPMADSSTDISVATDELSEPVDRLQADGRLPADVDDDAARARETLEGELARSAPEESSNSGSAVPGGALPPGANENRPQEMHVYTRIAVDGVDDLSTATSTAMSLVRALGGYTASSNFAVPNGEHGESALVLKVPTGRVEEALEGIAGLGVVASQRADLFDLGDQLGEARRRSRSLSDRALALRAQLEAAPSNSQLAAELTAVERRIAQQQRMIGNLTERARLATINLTLTTDGPTVEREQNRFAAAFMRSFDRLSGVLEWLISAGVFVLPLAALAWLGVRFGRGLRRRREQAVLQSS